MVLSGWVYAYLAAAELNSHFDIHPEVLKAKRIQMYSSVMYKTLPKQVVNII